jgi:hypothetical protein
MQTERGSDAGQKERLLTVAQVRLRTDHAEVMFYESARIYRLLRTNPAYDDALRLLRESAQVGAHVVVEFAAANSDLIRHVKQAK